MNRRERKVREKVRNKRGRRHRSKKSRKVIRKGKWRGKGDKREKNKTNEQKQEVI